MDVIIDTKLLEKLKFNASNDNEYCFLDRTSDIDQEIAEEIFSGLISFY
jgi:uncharacterized protein YdeI (BOF family)